MQRCQNKTAYKPFLIGLVIYIFLMAIRSATAQPGIDVPQQRWVEIFRHGCVEYGDSIEAARDALLASSCAQDGPITAFLESCRSPYTYRFVYPHIREVTVTTLLGTEFVTIVRYRAQLLLSCGSYHYAPPVPDDIGEFVPQ